jgi:hypothetical protein
MTEISIDTERARMGDAEKWMAGEISKDAVKIAALRCHPLTGS